MADQTAALRNSEREVRRTLEHVETAETRAGATERLC